MNLLFWKKEKPKGPQPGPVSDVVKKMAECIRAGDWKEGEWGGIEFAKERALDVRAHVTYADNLWAYKIGRYTHACNATENAALTDAYEYHVNQSAARAKEALLAYKVKDRLAAP